MQEIVGPGPITIRGNMYGFTVEDYIPKYAEAYPLANEAEWDIAVVWVNELFARFGVPQIQKSEVDNNF